MFLDDFLIVFEFLNDLLSPLIIFWLNLRLELLTLHPTKEVVLREYVANRTVVDTVLFDHISYTFLVYHMVIYDRNSLLRANLWTILAPLGFVAKHILVVIGNSCLVPRLCLLCLDQHRWLICQIMHGVIIHDLKIFHLDFVICFYKSD